MKQFFFILILSFCMTSSFAQSESENIKVVTDKFTDFYNRDQPDSIFALFDDNMKKALPIEKVRDVLTGLKASAGKITSRELTKSTATYAIYKTTFERTLFSLVISLDNNSLINGLRFNPYVDETVAFLKRNTTKMLLPFKDEWTVVWGGDTESQNYHVTSKAQKMLLISWLRMQRGVHLKQMAKAMRITMPLARKCWLPVMARS
ncbi:DUF3887 domain-containing protein [Paraflavitalea speifideaquila]|uniref:DUF3887 domain-containing protein n=1 Tax=Paraflavitalea speifideaquila TaxID=3076558 RepID=UPI0028EB2624|nr:DUF3887 domain-containing protein [Paraflavitalea speifideiaquila]